MIGWLSHRYVACVFALLQSAVFGAVSCPSSPSKHHVQLHRPPSPLILGRCRGDLHAVIAEVAVLCLDYTLRASALGPILHLSQMHCGSCRVMCSGADPCAAKVPLAAGCSRLFSLSQVAARQHGAAHRGAKPVSTLWVTMNTICCTQVALRGNMELRKEVLGTLGKRGRPGLKDQLLDALNKVPAAASAALMHLGELRGLVCYHSAVCGVCLGGSEHSLAVHTSRHTPVRQLCLLPTLPSSLGPGLPSRRLLAHVAPQRACARPAGKHGHICSRHGHAPGAPGEWGGMHLFACLSLEARAGAQQAQPLAASVPSN